MLELSAHGRLGQQPREISTSTGTRMAVVSLAVTVSVAKCDDPGTLWYDLAAFGRHAEDLLKHGQGDLVSVMGRVQLRVWTDQAGQERQNQQIVVEALMSAKTVRPGGGRKCDNASSNGQPRAEQRQQQATDRFQQTDRTGQTAMIESDADRAADRFNDEIPF